MKLSTALLTVFSLTLLLSAKVFSFENYLLQGAFYGENWNTSSAFVGGGFCGNFYLEDFFSCQFVVQGDREKFEMSPGVIFAPLGSLMISPTSSDGKFKTVLAGAFFLLSALENPNFHAELTDHVDLSLSAHFLRIQFGEYQNYPKAGIGSALNITPNKHFTISPYSELSTRWQKHKPIGLQGGIRLGWKF